MGRTDADVRAELVEVIDGLNALPNDAFADRVALRDRQEELRAALVDAHGDELARAKDEWNAQSGLKVPEDKGDISGTIPSPSDIGMGV